MLRTSESETEILLGNKQPLGIFFVAATLLGLAFYGGYVVGRGGAVHKTPAPAAQTGTESSSTALAIPTTGGETHSVPADSGAASGASSTDSASTANNITNTNELPLGSPKRKNLAKTQPAAPSDFSPSPTDTSTSNGAFTPKAGQTFLQVTAVGRDEAVAIADVLEKKGFRAHAVPKPGSSKLYRVLVGPVHDAGDLSSTRDSLRKTGFREVIVQRY
jgi:cell division septation protein DedD